jgi:hypothetical protein
MTTKSPDLSDIYYRPVTKPHPIRLYERQLTALKAMQLVTEKSLNQMIRDAVDLYIEAYNAKTP